MDRGPPARQRAARRDGLRRRRGRAAPAQRRHLLVGCPAIPLGTGRSGCPVRRARCARAGRRPRGRAPGAAAAGRVRAGVPAAGRPLDRAAGARAVDGYTRWLRLDEGVAGHSWTSGTQEAFVSHPASVLVVHRTWTGGPGGSTCGSPPSTPSTSRSASPPVVDHPAACRPTPRPTTCAARAWSATRLRARASRRPSRSRSSPTASSTPGPDGLRLRGATWATLVVATATDYAGPTTPLHGDAAAAACSGAVDGHGGRGPRVLDPACRARRRPRGSLRPGGPRPRDDPGSRAAHGRAAASARGRRARSRAWRRSRSTTAGT